MLIELLLAAQIVVPQHHGLVNDTARVLSPTKVATLEQQLRDYERRTTHEIAILTVTSLNGVSIEEFATKVFHEWGVGKKEADNGVLFVWSTGDRKVRIEVGYGLEAALPDGRAGQIIRQNITPQLREQRWDAGVQNGIDAIISTLDNPAVAVTLPTSNDSSLFVPLALILIPTSIIIFFCVGWVIARRRDRREAERRQRVESSVRTSSRFTPTYVRSVVQPDEEVPRRRATPRRTVEEPTRSSDYSSPSSLSDWSSSSSSSSGSFDSGGSFGGGDSGGGGASGDY